MNLFHDFIAKIKFTNQTYPILLNKKSCSLEYFFQKFI